MHDWLSMRPQPLILDPSLFSVLDLPLMLLHPALSIEVARLFHCLKVLETIY